MNYIIRIWALLIVVFLMSCAEQNPTAVTADKEDGFIMRDVLGNRPNTTARPSVITGGHTGLQPSHVRGARIYDDLFIELDAASPGPNPMLAIGAGATLADTDSWRCSQCHGFDYEGGVLTFNNGATNNLLELRDVRGRDEEFVFNMLQTGFDAWDGAQVVNVHNYSALLSEQAIVDVSDFVVNEIFDTHEFVRAPASGALGDMVEGMAMYESVAVDAIPPLARVDGSNFNCVDCHGADARSGTAAIDIAIVAWSDPFRFLHRTLFGSPRSLATFPGFSVDPMVMPGLYEVILTDGLHFGGPEQGSAIMAHVQAL